MTCNINHSTLFLLCLFLVVLRVGLKSEAFPWHTRLLFADAGQNYRHEEKSGNSVDPDKMAHMLF